MISIPTTRDDHRIAGLAALAIAIHWLESAFPSPLPGVKPGLANVVTLVVLLRYGWSAAAWVTILRIVGGSVLLGTFLSPAFLLSCSGAVAALAALGLGDRWSRAVPSWSLGPVGLSISAAVAHMGGQFYAAYRFFVPHEGLFHLLPILLVVAMLFGAVSGLVAHAVIKNLEISSS